MPGTQVVLLEQDPKMDGFETLEEWVLHGGDAPQAHEAAAIADQLGIDLSRPTATASGGERRRAAITRALAQDPYVLLLDEPTNHLDLGAIEWLEEWLKRFKGAFIVISHDRTFLTRLTRSILWLDRGQIRRAEIGFGGFEAWTERVYEEEARAAEKLDAKLKLELHWLQRGVTARRRRNQGRLAKLHEMRAQRAAMLGSAGTAKLALAKDDVRSKTVIDAEHVTKSLWRSRDHPRLHAPHAARRPDRRRRAERRGQDDLAQAAHGRAEAGHRHRHAGQDAERHRDRPAAQADGSEQAGEGCARQWRRLDRRPGHEEAHQGLSQGIPVRSCANRRADRLPVGWRAIASAARAGVRAAANLLVLDEPTNDLDLETLDLLQEVIADYDGTVLIVSHDRDFLDRTVTITLGLDGSGKVDVVAGGYEDWVRKRYQDHRSPAKGAVQGNAKAAPSSAKAMPGNGKKLTYKDQRDYDRLPAEIERLEAEVAADEARYPTRTSTAASPCALPSSPSALRATAPRSRRRSCVGWKSPSWRTSSAPKRIADTA